MCVGVYVPTETDGQRWSPLDWPVSQTKMLTCHGLVSGSQRVSHH